MEAWERWSCPPSLQSSKWSKWNTYYKDNLFIGKIGIIFQANLFKCGSRKEHISMKTSRSCPILTLVFYVYLCVCYGPIFHQLVMGCHYATRDPSPLRDPPTQQGTINVYSKLNMEDIPGPCFCLKESLTAQLGKTLCHLLKGWYKQRQKGNSKLARLFFFFNFSGLKVQLSAVLFKIMRDEFILMSSVMILDGQSRRPILHVWMSEAGNVQGWRTEGE